MKDLNSKPLHSKLLFMLEKQYKNQNHETGIQYKLGWTSSSWAGGKGSDDDI